MRLGQFNFTILNFNQNEFQLLFSLWFLNLKAFDAEWNKSRMLAEFGTCLKISQKLYKEPV